MKLANERHEVASPAKSLIPYSPSIYTSCGKSQENGLGDKTPQHALIVHRLDVSLYQSCICHPRFAHDGSKGARQTWVDFQRIWTVTAVPKYEPQWIVNVGWSPLPDSESSDPETSVPKFSVTMGFGFVACILKTWTKEVKGKFGV